MISKEELKEITNKSKTKDRLELWWNLSEDKLNKFLLEKAKLGKHYLHLSQANLKWMSVPEFRYLVMFRLSEKGYSVKDLGSNCIQVKWD